MKKMYKKLFSNNFEGTIGDYVVIEGVVGAGKNEIRNLLLDEGYLPEYEERTNDELLSKFYHDKSRYALQLQVHYLTKRLKQIKKATSNGTIVSRSIYGDLMFAKLQNINDDITDEELEIITDLIAEIIEDIPKPKLLVYLKISTTAAMNKIKQRGRIGESSSTYAYWDNLNREYERFIREYALSPVLEIDVTYLDLINDIEDREYVRNLIINKFEEVQFNEEKFNRKEQEEPI